MAVPYTLYILSLRVTSCIPSSLLLTLRVLNQRRSSRQCIPAAVRDQPGSDDCSGSSLHLCSGLGVNPYLFTLISHRLHSQDSPVFKARASGWEGGSINTGLRRESFLIVAHWCGVIAARGKEKQIFTLDQEKGIEQDSVFYTFALLSLADAAQWYLEGYGYHKSLNLQPPGNVAFFFKRRRTLAGWIECDVRGGPGAVK